MEHHFVKRYMMVTWLTFLSQNMPLDVIPKEIVGHVTSSFQKRNHLFLSPCELIIKRVIIKMDGLTRTIHKRYTKQ